MNILFVFIGGGLGSIVRYAISKMILNLNLNSHFPLATFISNLTSSLILALTIYYLQAKLTLNDSLKLFVVTGFCGGFSTFSTFSYETFELYKMGYPWLAVINILVSALACIGIIYILFQNTQ